MRIAMFSEYNDLGAVAAARRRRMSGYGALRRRLAVQGFAEGFGASDQMVSLGNQALDRFSKVVADADAQLAKVSLGQRAWDFVTGQWSTVESMSNRVAMLHTTYDDFKQKVNDPATDDAKIAEIIDVLGHSWAVSVDDLKALIKATAPSTQLPSFVPTVPQILGPIPWWVWGIGAVAVLGLLASLRRK